MEKDIPVLAKCTGELEQIETTNMNWKCLRSDFSVPWVLFSYLDIKYLFLLEFFFSYLSVKQPQIITEDSDKLRKMKIIIRKLS